MDNKYLELSKCGECPLNKMRVLGEGTSDSSSYDVVIVGIAPATAEVRAGRPLVGWSGTLLRKVLAKLGLEEFYLTNALLCPVDDSVKESEKNRALECCKNRLLEEVKSKNPKLVVALGNDPLKVLTGVDYKVKSVQGRVIPGLVCPVLPVINPASLSHRAEEFYDLVDSFKAGISFLDGSYQQAVIPEAIVVDKDNIVDVLNELDKYELIAIDLETTGKGFYPYGVEPDKIRCICLAVDCRRAFIFPGESSPYFEPHPNYASDERLKSLLSKKKLIFHNSSFDMGFLMQAGFRVKVFADTLLAHYCLDERQYSHGLKDLASKYLGAPDWEEEIKAYLPHKTSSYDLVPDDVLYKYAACDVAYTYQLSEGVGLRKKAESMFPYTNILIPCSNMFAEIRHKGILIDVGLLMELDSLLDAEFNELVDELTRITGVYINPLSPSEVAELLYDILGYQPIPGFGRSTSTKVLNLLGGEVCDKIREIREFGKLKSTYVVGLASFIDKNFRIHPLTKLYGTVTGRISVVDPSIMNVHKKGGVRRLYLPSKGYMILEADQKQMELRCLALAAQDEKLLEIIRRFDRGEGPDPHQLVNEELNKRTGKQWERDKAKAGVFGRAYGRGKRDFMLSYRMSEKDTEDLLNIIDSFLPGLKAYNQRVREEIHTKGVLTSYFGRKRRFGLILDENKHEYYRQGANFYPQSMGSDLNLLTMLRLWEMKDKLGIYPLFPVHDSIVMEIPSVEVAPLIKKEMESYCYELVGGKLTFKVDCSVGPNWGDVQKLKL